MPRLPMYEQQTRPSGAEMSPRAAGAGIGEAMIAGGDALAQVGANIQRRADVIEQVRRYGEFETEAISMFEATVAGEDISNPEVVSNYQQALRQKMDQTLNNFSGTRASRDALRAQLENAVTQQTKGMMAAQIKAQNEMIGRTVESRFNEIGRRTFDAPSLLIDGMVDIERTIAEFAPALPAGSEQILRQQGRAQLATQAINGFIARGDLDGAEAVMKDPTFQKELDAETYRKLRVGVTAERGKFDKEQRELQSKYSTMSKLLGVADLTPEQKDMVRNFGDASMSKMSMLAMYSDITGKMPDAEVLLRAAGLDDASRQGGFLELAQQAAYYQMNWDKLTPEEQFVGRAVLSKLGKDTSNTTLRKDDQGRLTEIPLGASPMAEYLVPGRGLAAGAAAPAPRPQAVPPQGQPAPRATTPVMETPIGAGVDEELGSAPEFSQGETAPRGEFRAQDGVVEVDNVSWQPRLDTDLSITDRLIGTGSYGPRAFLAFTSRIPGLGRNMPGGQQNEEILKARSVADRAVTDLVTVLQNNPKFAEGERQQLAKDVGGFVRFFDEPNTFLDNLYATDIMLERRLNKYREIANDPSQTLEVEQDAKALVKQIELFRKEFGVRRPQTRDEFEMMIRAGDLRPGEVWFARDGTPQQLTPEQYQRVMRGGGR